jgi:hypothetical protein
MCLGLCVVSDHAQHSDYLQHQHYDARMGITLVSAFNPLLVAANLRRERQA